MAMAAGALAQSVASPSSTSLFGSSFGSFGSPTGLAAAGAAAACAKAASGYFLALAETLLVGHVVQRVRLAAMDDLLSRGTHLPSPDALARVATRTTELSSGLRHGVLGFVRAALALLPLAACLLFLSPVLSTIAFATMLGFTLVSSRARKFWRRSSSRAQAGAEALHSEVNELVGNVSLWRTYGAGRSVREAVALAGDAVTRSEARVAAHRAALSGANEVFAAAALVAAIAASATDLTTMLLPFAAVFFMAYRPVRDLGDARGWLEQGEQALRALRRVAPPRAPSKIARTQTWPCGTLVLDRFGALSRGPRLSTRIRPGSVVLVRGPTGIGKTTLFRGMLGLEPSVGRLEFGDHDLSNAAVGPDARPFAWVPQDAPLVTGSLRDNVRLAAESATAIDEALSLVGLGQLLANIGDTPVGPRGRPLSGGERRRVAVARAVATGLPVLLLDEPTEGLDPDATDRMLKALERLRGSRTVLVSSHRPELAAVADDVIDLDGIVPVAAE